MSIDSSDTASQQSDRNYQILLEAIPDLMLRLSREGICLDFRLPRSFRVVSSEFDWQGKYLWEIIPPEVAAQRMKYIELAIATNEIQIYEQQIEFAGRIQYEEVRVIRCNDQEALVIIRDVSDRKYAEQALKQSEAQFQRLAANVPGMLYQFRLAPDGRPSFPYVSAFSEELWELEPDVIYHDASLLINQIHPDDRAEFERTIQESAVQLQPWSWTGRIVPPSGKPKWIQAHSRPELQTDGSILWDGMLIDVSDRIRIEEERKRAERAIAESEARFRSFVENANDLIFAFSPAGVFTYLSPKVTEITGFLASELIGHAFADYIHPDDLPIAYASVEQLLKTGERQTEIEFRARRKDGSWYWALSNTAAIKGSNGTVISILGIVRDISDRKANEEALRRSEAQLRQQAIDLEKALQDLQRTQSQLIHSEKMSSLGQLVAGIAHEINNPISFIYGNISHATTYFENIAELLELYQKHYPDPHSEIKQSIEDMDLEFVFEDLMNLFSSMRTGAERIREIVLSLRTFSRLDEAELKSVNIHDGIESTLTILQNRLNQKHKIKVIKHYAELPKVECFAGSLNQVFLQIITNAIDALEFAIKDAKWLEKQQQPTIELYTEQISSAQIRIRIIDNGLGISKVVQARMFDPFFTTKPIGKGTGMGLATSYQIVTEQHQGRLTCCSTELKGAEFAIDLPIRQAKSLMP
ncbi:PAS domain S-box protein [Leptolyngbya sp. AN03gr2]|uniref:PAS domain S-box protein n=1 Tax=unclassified Leptolyngbya TaxID=2650499 RepID=UPI003D3180DD